jgi:hypothetical protein
MSRCNPIIDRELAKHKIIIEERFSKSYMNAHYKFQRIAVEGITENGNELVLAKS